MRKATISFVMSVRPSVRLFVRIGQLGSRWTDFYEILYLRLFQKFVDKIQVSLKPDKRNDTLHEDIFTFMSVPR